MNISGHDNKDKSSRSGSVLSTNQSSKPANRSNIFGDESVSKSASGLHSAMWGKHGVEATQQNVTILFVTSWSSELPADTLVRGSRVSPHHRPKMSADTLVRRTFWDGDGVILVNRVPKCPPAIRCSMMSQTVF